MSQSSEPDPAQPASGPPPAAQAGYGFPPPAYHPAVPPGPPGTYFDRDSGLWLPEGTTLASHGRRIGAWFLSWLIGLVTLGIGYAVWSLIIWGYGQTPVMQILGMRCYEPHAVKAAGWWRMALREIVGRFVEGILGTITQLISFIFFLARSDRRNLPDLVAGTVVLHDPHHVLARGD